MTQSVAYLFTVSFVVVVVVVWSWKLNQILIKCNLIRLTVDFNRQKNNGIIFAEFITVFNVSAVKYSVSICDANDVKHSNAGLTIKIS